MKAFLTYFFKPGYRTLLFWLFIRPQSIEQLSKKSKLEQNLYPMLDELTNAELVEPLSGHTSHTGLYRLRPAVRQNIGQALSRILISLIFVAAANILSKTDEVYERRQTKRIRKSWNS